MKKLIITTIWLLASLVLFSQTEAIEFKYDAAGNRTERHVIELKAPEKNQEERYKNQELQNGDEVVYEERLGDMEVSLFPNPTKGELTISIRQTTAHMAGAQDSGQTNGRIEVFSVAGEKVFEQNEIGNETNVDLSDLPDGVYVLNIFVGEMTSTWKIVKE